MRTRLVSIAALLVDGLYLVDILLRVSSFKSHTSVVRAALSIREYTASCLLAALTTIQVFLCVTLLSPHLYAKMGALSSCMVMATTSLFETMIYGSVADSFHTRKVVLVVFTVTILGLFRNETNVRSTAIETPIGDKWVNVHANIRMCATKYGVARYTVPLSCLAFVRMLWFLLSMSHGIQAEVNVAASSTSASVCAILLILGGLDTSDSLGELVDIVMRYARDLRPRIHYNKNIKNNEKKL